MGRDSEQFIGMGFSEEQAISLTNVKRRRDENIAQDKTHNHLMFVRFVAIQDGRIDEQGRENEGGARGWRGNPLNK